MVNCSFCEKKLKRNIFCSGSCKTRFHRGDLESENKVKEYIEKKEVQETPKEGKWVMSKIAGKKVFVE